MAPSNGNGSAKWQTWASFGTLGFLVIGGLITFLLQVNGLSNQVTSLTNENSEISRRLARVETQAQTNEVEIAKIEDSQTEIDTQLRASIDEYCKSLVWQQRINGLVWNKAFKGVSEFPGQVFFCPNIADGKPQ
jgi:hypothetical protein